MGGRAMAVPALVCLALGVLLGGWGWTQRDAARDRIIVVEDGGDGGFFSPPPEVSEEQRRVQACSLLLAASRVQAPDFATFGFGPTEGGFDPQAPTVSTIPPPPAAVASSLVSVLDPEIVTGVPALEVPEVVLAISSERAAIEVVLAAGGDITTDPEVLRSAQRLGEAISGTC